MAKKENRHAELVSASANFDAPYELPEGWKWCRLPECVSIVTGKKDANYGTPDGKYLFFTCAEQPLRCDDYSFEGESLLLPGNGANVGQVIYYDGQFEVYQRTYVLQKIIESFSLKYLYYHILGFWENYNHDKQYGSATNYIKMGNFLNYIFPLPPTLAEQQRIVNRIETMFAKLDEAKEKAQNVVDSFETRKAAILHKAFNGQLKIDNEELTIDDWEEKKLGDIVNGFKYGVSDKCDYKNDGIPVLRIPNVGDGTIDFTDLKYSERNNIEENYIVKENDILIIRSNGSRELVGKSALYNNTDKQFSYGSFLIKITPSEVVNPKYLVTFLNSDDARNQMFNKAKSSSGIHNINTKELSEIKLKLPSLNYQLSIVNFLDSILEKESRAKEAAQTVLDQIALLKKSILARAFRGEL